MISAEGGVDIEEVAAKTPEKIHKAYVDPGIGLAPFQAQRLAFAVGLTGDAVKKATKMMLALYQAFVATDASLLEINPLITTTGGDLLALDAKMNFDDNALYRHPDVRDLRDLSEEDPLEVEASKYSLNYIRLDGNIGCMVNGAGLAMATMDIIKLSGGMPANFLDVGGGASAEQIRNAFKILMSDKNVKAVLINIFGGILRCDVLAAGVIAAVKELGVPVPIVIRMKGTNVEEGKKMLAESGLNFTTADTMGEGADHRRRAGRRGSLMAVLLDSNTRLIVQGLTGREGTFHAKAAAAYHTKVVGGVTPGKGGTTHEGMAGVQYRRRRGSGDRCERVGHLRSAAVCRRRHHGGGRRGLALVVCITEGIPVVDMLKAMTFLKSRPGTRLIGPNCPGIISPGKGKAGIIPDQHLQGRPYRHRVEERHAHLRGYRPADEREVLASPPASVSAATR